MVPIGLTLVRSIERNGRFLKVSRLDFFDGRRFSIRTHMPIAWRRCRLQKRLGAETMTGSRVGEVQRIFRDIYNLGANFAVDGRPTRWTDLGVPRDFVMAASGHKPSSVHDRYINFTG